MSTTTTSGRSGRRTRQRATRSLAVLVAAATLGATLTSCARGSAAHGRTLQVVAGENTWGSLAAQLGGSHASVTSIVTDPNADPHEYESNTTDARLFAGADVVILNGAGYDSWGDRLLSANPETGRSVLDVATLLGKKNGDNPHFWYSPDYVDRVMRQITADYIALDPTDRAYFEARLASTEQALGTYRATIGAIRALAGGAPVGATEDIVVYLCDALGLDLVSPPSFMQAVAEGNDPPAQSMATFSDQLARHQVRALIYNTQTATAVTTNIKRQATDRGIPVVGVTEIMRPPTATFQSWQVSQLDALANALGIGPAVRAAVASAGHGAATSTTRSVAAS